MIYGVDGNQVCCTYDNFECLAVDAAGFGDSCKEAFIDLMEEEKYPRADAKFTRLELQWILEVRRPT